MLENMAYGYAGHIMRFKEDVIKTINPTDLIKKDPKELAMINRGLNLIDETVDLIIAQSEALDEINAKLDTLISLQ